jgi:hypothetical protein
MNKEQRELRILADALDKRGHHKQAGAVRDIGHIKLAGPDDDHPVDEFLALHTAVTAWVGVLDNADGIYGAKSKDQATLARIVKAGADLLVYHDHVFKNWQNKKDYEKAKAYEDLLSNKYLGHPRLTFPDLPTNVTDLGYYTPEVEAWTPPHEWMTAAKPFWWVAMKRKNSEFRAWYKKVDKYKLQFSETQEKSRSDAKGKFTWNGRNELYFAWTGQNDPSDPNKPKGTLFWVWKKSSGKPEPVYHCPSNPNTCVKPPAHADFNKGDNKEKWDESFDYFGFQADKGASYERESLFKKATLPKGVGGVQCKTPTGGSALPSSKRPPAKGTATQDGTNWHATDKGGNCSYLFTGTDAETNAKAYANTTQGKAKKRSNTSGARRIYKSPKGVDMKKHLTSHGDGDKFREWAHKTFKPDDLNKLVAGLASNGQGTFDNAKPGTTKLNSYVGKVWETHGDAYITHLKGGDAPVEGGPQAARKISDDEMRAYLTHPGTLAERNKVIEQVGLTASRDKALAEKASDADKAAWAKDVESMIGSTVVKEALQAAYRTDTADNMALQFAIERSSKAAAAAAAKAKEDAKEGGTKAKGEGTGGPQAASGFFITPHSNQSYDKENKTYKLGTVFVNKKDGKYYYVGDLDGKRKLIPMRARPAGHGGVEPGIGTLTNDEVTAILAQVKIELPEKYDLWETYMSEKKEGDRVSFTGSGMNLKSKKTQLEEARDARNALFPPASGNPGNAPGE